MNFSYFKKIFCAWLSVADSKLVYNFRDEFLKILKSPYKDFKDLLAEIRDSSLRSILKEGEWYDKGLKTLEALSKKKVKFTYIFNKNYPKNLYKLKDPPFFLSYMGSPIWNDVLKLSVVGSRNPSTKSLKWMEDNLLVLFENGVCSISGAAIGIDQKTHTLSTRVKKPTISILPSGINNIYPKSAIPMIDEIIACGGAVISEYSLGQTMLKFNFHNRNRLIAAMGDATLIVEARIRSGTMITAVKAMEINQPLAVLPAFPTDSKACGNVKLLMDGVVPVRDSDDLLIMMGGQTNFKELNKL